MLKIIPITPDLIALSRQELPESYIKSQEKKSTFIESIVARYIIFMQEKFLPKTDKHGKPEWLLGKYWSISHKEGLIFVATDNKPVGVDIEIITSRSQEILNIHTSGEYDIFGEKTMVSFYLLWVAKESVIKLFLSELDSMQSIIIDSIHDFSKHIDGVRFQFKFFGNFQNKKFVGYIGIDEKKVYAVSYYL